MNSKALCAALFFIASCLPLHAQDNPFFSGTGRVSEGGTRNSPGVLRELFDRINGLQRGMNERLAELSRLVKEERSAGVFFILLAIAFAYGLVHALGPGHGKIIMVSYAMANPLKAKHGVLLGVGVSVVHTLSAVALISVLYLILRGSYAQYAGGPKRAVLLVSYGLIAGMGAVFTYNAVRRTRRREQRIAETDKTPGPAEGNCRDLVVPAFMIGLVPCEGAVLLLVFSLSIDSFWLGLILTAAMSAGMAVTISVVGLIALGAKKGSFKLLSWKGAPIGTAVSILRFLGAFAILLLGASLFIVTVLG
jgi:nickel/cobalt exporter